MKYLLVKTRMINKLVQNSLSSKEEFDELAQVLGSCVRANIYLLDSFGNVIGYHIEEDCQCEFIKHEVTVNKKFPVAFNLWLQKVQETSTNITQKDGKCIVDEAKPCVDKERFFTFVPVNGAGERLGSLVISRCESMFEDDDLILGEYAASVLAMKILQLGREEIESEARKKAAVQVAVGTLSYSELAAINHVFRELEGNEGLLIASKIADQVGLTRSVIVNALRKFESAGVIETKSLGMKGTYIRILNERLPEELAKIRA